jgi:hypothetical protein
MKTRRPKVTVPADLVADADRALAGLDAARARLDEALRAGARLEERRAARAEVTAAFGTADRLLRTITALTRPGPYVEWSRWRHRLSQLDRAKQQHLFAQSDDLPCLRVGSVRAVDTGMSGPFIGELQHGRSRPAGAPATYGLDLEQALRTPPAVNTTPAAARPAASPTPSQPEASQPQPVQPIAA